MALQPVTISRKTFGTKTIFRDEIASAEGGTTEQDCLNGYSTIDLELPATIVLVTAIANEGVGRAPKDYRRRDHRMARERRWSPRSSARWRSSTRLRCAKLQNLAGVEVDDPVAPSPAASIGDASVAAPHAMRDRLVALG